MKYEKMLKKGLVALLEKRDKEIARTRKLTSKVTNPYKEKIAELRDPVQNAEFICTFLRLFTKNEQPHILQLFRSRFQLSGDEAARMLQAILAWNDVPEEDRSVTSSEREALRKEHFKLNQRLAKQDAQIERLIIERTRARQKTQDIARLVSVYRRVLGDILGDPDVVVAPSLAATPREQVQLLAETPDHCSGVFSDEVLKDRNKTAFDEVGE